MRASHRVPRAQLTETARPICGGERGRSLRPARRMRNLRTRNTLTIDHNVLITNLDIRSSATLFYV
jgi:hypothetical protein